MSNVPEGAQLSDDGNYWWDGSQWQLVSGQQQSSEASGDVPAELVAMGAPARLADWTEAQRKAYFTGEGSEPHSEVSGDDAAGIEVLAIADTAGDEGEVLA